jgi:hypothetical protein
MANSAEQTLPIVNAVNELRESNKDQRERLQKSMRAGLLNVKKSVDSLSLSFERSLIEQGDAQAKMHEATMAFQEATLEQGQHSGHLFAAKVTALGAGLVAWFQNNMLLEFKQIKTAFKEGKVVHVKGDAGKSGKSDNELLMLINEGMHGNQKTNLKNTLLRIEDTLLKHPAIADVLLKEEVAKQQALKNLTDEQRDLFELIKNKREGHVVSALKEAEDRIEAQREEDSDSIKESAETGNTKDVKEGLGWWQKIFKGVATLGAGILIYENWDKIKDGLIGIKNFIHGTYKFVANNWDTFKLILEGTAIVYAGVWAIEKSIVGWKALVLITGTTITAAKATTVLLSAAFTTVKTQLGLVLAAVTPWLLPIAGILWAGNALLDAFGEADKEFEKTGSAWEAVKAGTAQFHESLITGPLDLVTSIAAWVAGVFGFPEIEKKLNQIDSKKLYDDMQRWTTDLIQDMFDWIKDSFNAVKDWLFPDPTEIKQSVMSDPNIQPLETLTPGMIRSIEESGANQGFLLQRDKEAYDSVLQHIKNKESVNTPSGNGAGDQIIRGTIDGVPISTSNNTTVAPINNTVQNNTSNSTTVMQPINTQPRGPSIMEGQMIRNLLVPY